MEGIERSGKLLIFFILQVKGVNRLRVADASIMPIIMTGHTNIPTIMIGEKLADMVKEDWGLIDIARVRENQVYKSHKGSRV